MPFLLAKSHSEWEGGLENPKKHAYVRSEWSLIWQYQLWSFQGRDTKLERFLAKINCIQMKLPNFENWSNGELSKSTKI